RVRDLAGKPTVLILDGERHPAEDGFFETGVKPLVLVTTREGYSFRATGDHLIRRVARRPRPSGDLEWAAAGALKPGDQVVLSDNRDLRGWPGPGSASEGRLLGLLLGEGMPKEDGAALCVGGDGEG